MTTTTVMAGLREGKKPTIDALYFCFEYTFVRPRSSSLAAVPVLAAIV